jgi:hypothetical protein
MVVNKAEVGGLRAAEGARDAGWDGATDPGRAVRLVVLDLGRQISVVMFDWQL